MSKRISLKRETISGTAWNFTELFLRRGVGGLTTLILAWFVTPEDFGLIAMMALFLAFASLIADAGFTEALIRKSSVSASEYDTAFYANIFFSVVVYILLFVTAPLIASFYEQSSLINLIRITGLIAILNALVLVQRAKLSRQLKFKLQMQVSLPSAIISAMSAIVLAYAGFGVWALVAQMLIQALLNTILYWRLDIWRPGLQFGWREFKELFSFGGYLLFNQMTTVPVKHMYVVVIAKVFAAPVAGLYFFAEKIRDLLINQLVSSIETVTYPALARFQEDPERLKHGYRQVIAATTFLFFPILIFLATFVETLFHLLLPEAWWPAAVYLQLMCLAALLYPLHSTNLNILKVKGRSDLVFYLGLFKKTVAITIFVISFRYGIVAILLGQILSSVIAYLPNSFYSKRLIGYSLHEQLADFLPGLLLSGLIGFGLWWMLGFLNWHEITKLFVLGIIGVIAYFLGAWLLKLRGFDLARDLIFMRLKGKVA